jgi:hypothetical protein
MKIHEYQGKEILRPFAVSTPRGRMKGEGVTGSVLDPLGTEGAIPSLFPLPKI